MTASGAGPRGALRTLTVGLGWGNAPATVGTLAQEGRRVFFEFEPGFLRSALDLSPFKLPPVPGVREHTDRDYGPLFGLFQDSLPDAWGLLLMDRDFRRRGVEAATLTPLDRLAWIGSRGMGALTYHPPDAEGEPSTSMDLAQVAAQAGRILEGSPEEVLPALRWAGGSPGGARPKVVVGVGPGDRMLAGAGLLPEGFRHWIVKFPARQDGSDAGRVEAAYAEMAREAGLQLPETRLFETGCGDAFFGAHRFDRPQAGRLHMHTLGGLLHASHHHPSLDYEGYLRVTFALTRDRRQLLQAFRRMVFNVLAHVRDDHVKNFAYLMDSAGRWALSPAYDLVFASGPGGEHSMTVEGEGRTPGREHILRLAGRLDVDARQAELIQEEVAEAVAGWPRHAQGAGVPRARVAGIQRVLRNR